MVATCPLMATGATVAAKNEVAASLSSKWPGQMLVDVDVETSACLAAITIRCSECHRTDVAEEAGERLAVGSLFSDVVECPPEWLIGGQRGKSGVVKALDEIPVCRARTDALIPPGGTWFGAGYLGLCQYAMPFATAVAGARIGAECEQAGCGTESERQKFACGHALGSLRHDISWL